MVMLTGSALVSPTFAQTPDLRKVAATGPDYPGLDEQPVWETRIAAGSNRIIAVFNVGPRDGAAGVTRVGYAIAQQSGSNWNWTTQGLIPNVTDYATGFAIDPDIAYDATANDFLASSFIGLYDNPPAPSTVTRLAIARYSSSSSPFAAGWPALDYSVPLWSCSPPCQSFQLGEYSGIAVRPSGDDWEIWASFVQMLPSTSETETDFSQIGAVRIPFSQ